MNKPAWVLLWAFVSACVYVPAFVVGVRWGIAGVAAGDLASTLLLVPIQLMLVQKLLSLRMRDYLARFVPVVAASAAMAAIVYGVQHFVPGEGMRIALALGLSLTARGPTSLPAGFL